MKLQKCEMCGKGTIRIHEHHIIPWRFSHDDSESNIMKLCFSCHSKADASFTNLILYGEMNVSKDTTKRVKRRYTKKYIAYKSLHTLRLLKNTFYYDMLYYNIKTGHINILHSWGYDKRRRRPERHIASGINIRKKLKKVASLKGQTSLSGAQR